MANYTKNDSGFDHGEDSEVLSHGAVETTAEVGEKASRKPLSKKAKIAIIIASVLMGIGLVVGLVFMIISLWPIEPAPRVVFAYGEFDYVILDDDSVEIVDYHGAERNIRIPTVIDDREVSSIGASAFEGHTELLTVQLGGFVRRISDSAFAGCSTMSEIVIPQSVREIGSYAFHKCLLLEKIDLPASLESIGKGAFSSSGIASFSLPVGITEIPDELFYLCNNLSEVNLGESIKTIGRSAFYGCKLITSLDLPYVERVEDAAFSECPDLQSVSFGAALRYVGEDVFYCSSSASVSGSGEIGSEDDKEIKAKLASITVSPENTHFTTEGGALVSIDDARLIILPPASLVESYTMPAYVRHISDHAFGGCEAIKEIIISPALETIGYGAFHSTINLARIAMPDSSPEATFDFPASLRSVGGNAFVNARCYALLKDEFTVIGDGILVKYTPMTDSDGRFVKTEHTAPVGSGNEVTVEVKIPEGIKAVASAFANQSRVSKVTGSSTVTEIGEYSFYQSGLIEVIDLSETSVRYIGDLAFSASPSIKTVILPNTLTEVGDMLFFSCHGLDNIILPASLTVVSEKMFADCIALKSVTLGANTTKIELYAFYGASALEEIILPESLEEIGDYAFAKSGIVEFTVPENVEIGTGLLLDAVELKKITIKGSGSTPAALCMGATSLETVIFDGEFTRIGNETFFNCTLLSGIDLPESVTEIGDYAFAQCSSLEYVNHSGKLSYLGSNAFHLASSLRSFEFPETLKSLGAYAFSNCAMLESADLKWVENIGRNAFENCGLIEKLDLRRVAYTIPAATFAWCESLTEVKLADTVTYIGEAAFIKCGALTSVRLPRELVTLGASAFYGCERLSDIEWGGKLEYIGAQAFSTCNSLKSVTLPASVTTIAENAFEKCVMLSEFYMNEGVTTLGSYCFAGCTSLLNIALPDSLEVIPEGCFAGSALVDVSAGSRIKKISAGAFSGCGLLEIFEVGTLLSVIEKQAFDYCESFRYFMYDGGEAMFARIEIGEGNDYLYSAYENYLKRHQ